MIIQHITQPAASQFYSGKPFSNESCVPGAALRLQTLANNDSFAGDSVVWASRDAIKESNFRTATSTFHINNSRGHVLLLYYEVHMSIIIQ